MTISSIFQYLASGSYHLQYPFFFLPFNQQPANQQTGKPANQQTGKTGKPAKPARRVATKNMWCWRKGAVFWGRRGHKTRSKTRSRTQILGFGVGFPLVRFLFFWLALRVDGPGYLLLAGMDGQGICLVFGSFLLAHGFFCLSFFPLFFRCSLAAVREDEERK